MLLFSFRALIRAILLTVVFLLVYLFRSDAFTTTKATTVWHQAAVDDPRCHAFPDPKTITIALTAGASSVTPDLLNRASTMLSCLHPSRLLFFSDLDHAIGLYRLHDVLSRADPVLLQTHPDFDFYRHQQAYASQGQNVRDLGELAVLRADTPQEDQHSPKVLEKYKYLHMIERAWELQPGRDWYVFADIQTYISWPNLVRWLGDMDSSKPHFLGRKVRLRDVDIDAGAVEGTIVLSGAAVETFATAAKSIARAWDRKAARMDSPSEVLATALRDMLRLNITDAWPLTIGIEPEWIPFQQEMWCEPVVSMPFASESLSQSLAQLEKQSLFSQKDFVLDYHHLFNLLSEGQNFAVTQFWDNASDEAERPGQLIHWSGDQDDDAESTTFTDDDPDPNTSIEACAKACVRFRDCMQLSYMSFAAKRRYDDKSVKAGGVCYLSKLFRFGRHRGINSWDEDDDAVRGSSVDNTQVWSSGWNIGRFKASRSRNNC